jgi:hypothetical protein
MKGPFDPQNLSIFSEIGPILEVSKELPGFHQNLLAVLKKHWRFGYDGIENCPTEFTWYADSDHTKKVACQGPDYIIINPDWYFIEPDEPGDSPKSKSAKIGDLKQRQKDLFLHELFLGITLGKGVDETALANVLEVLTQRPPPKSNELQRVLESSGFGVFGTRPDSNCYQVASNIETFVPIQSNQAGVTTAIAPLLVKKPNTKSSTTQVEIQIPFAMRVHKNQDVWFQGKNRLKAEPNVGPACVIFGMWLQTGTISPMKALAQRMGEGSGPYGYEAFIEAFGESSTSPMISMDCVRAVGSSNNQPYSLAEFEKLIHEQTGMELLLPETVGNPSVQDFATAFFPQQDGAGPATRAVVPGSAIPHRQCVPQGPGTYAVIPGSSICDGPGL